MRRIPHQLVTGLLLAIYGGIAVLGYGLHELAPDDAHHHHHGLAAAHQEPGPLAFRSGGSVDDDHDCDICAFLDQARSDRPQVATSIIWQHRSRGHRCRRTASFFANHARFSRSSWPAGFHRLILCRVRRDRFAPRFSFVLPFDFASLKIALVPISRGFAMRLDRRLRWLSSWS